MRLKISRWQQKSGFIGCADVKDPLLHTKETLLLQPVINDLIRIKRGPAPYPVLTSRLL
jgi:hypothetical protein